MHTSVPMKRARRYTMRRRAEAVAATRARIVRAALELHTSVGPARTPLSAVAERAGVQRHTVYAHFPDEAALFKACGLHFAATHPFPDVERWRTLRRGAGRLRHGLAEVYAFYGENAEIIEKVIRDMKLVPVGAGTRARIAAAAEVLAEGSRFHPAAVRLALDFHTWQSLAELGPKRAADLMAGMVAASSRSAEPRRRGRRDHAASQRGLAPLRA